MADDAGITDQPLDVLIAEARHLPEIEAGEGFAKIFAFAQDGQPRESRLESFEADLLEQADIIDDRAAPFAVMIDAIVFRAAAPEAARLAVVAADDAVIGRHLVSPP